MSSTPRRASLLLLIFAACGGSSSAPSAPSAEPATEGTQTPDATAPPDDVPEPSADELPVGPDAIAAKLAAPGAPAHIEGFVVDPSCFKEPMLEPATLKHMPEGAEISEGTVSIKDPTPRAFARLRKLVAAMAFEKSPRVVYAQLGAEGKHIGWTGMCLVEPPLIAAGELVPLKPETTALKLAKPALARLHALGPDVQSLAFVLDGSVLTLAPAQALAKTNAPVLRFGARK
jgi:hypothetical protein